MVDGLISGLTAKRETMKLTTAFKASVIQQAVDSMKEICFEKWPQIIETDETTAAVVLQPTMSAVLALLGHDGDITSWDSILVALQAENADVLGKMMNLKPESITIEQCSKAQSVFTAVIANDALSEALMQWVNAHIEYALHNAKCKEMDDQLASQQPLQRALETKIESIKVERKKKEEDCVRLNCRITEWKARLEEQIQREVEREEAKMDELKESEDKKVVADKVKHVQSMKNYLFIHCGNDLVSVHPVNPTFDLLDVASVDKKSSFCISRQYGAFFVYHSGNAIAQSPRLDSDDIAVVTRCDAVHPRWSHCFSRYQGDDSIFKSDDIKRYDVVSYDEGFGISGRLLVHCTMKANAPRRIVQFFNVQELEVLSESLRESQYRRNPGVDSKPFQMTLFVFEMLYGSDLVESVLEQYESDKQEAEMQRLKQLEMEQRGPGLEEEKELDLKSAEGWSVGDECIYYEDGAIVVDIEVTSEGLIKYLVLEVNGRDRVIVERSEVLEGEITRLEAVPKEQPSKPLDVIHDNPGGDGAVEMDEEGGGDELNAPEGDGGNAMEMSFVEIPAAGNVKAERSVDIMGDPGGVMVEAEGYDNAEQDMDIEDESE